MYVGFEQYIEEDPSISAEIQSNQPMRRTASKKKIWAFALQASDSCEKISETSSGSARNKRILNTLGLSLTSLIIIIFGFGSYSPTFWPINKNHFFLYDF